MATYIGTHDFTGGTAALQYQTAIGTTDISTASGTYADMTDMSITVSKAGTYLVIFSTTCTEDATTTSASIVFQLLHGATVLALSNQQHSTPSSSGGNGTGGCGIIVVRAGVAASDVIKVQWKLASGAQGYNRPATANEHRSLTILKIG
jgi:hypothetical protein